MYLARFGYLAPTATNPQSGALLSEETVTDAVKEFQVSLIIVSGNDIDARDNVREIISIFTSS